MREYEYRISETSTTVRFGFISILAESEEEAGMKLDDLSPSINDLLLVQTKEMDIQTNAELDNVSEV